MRHLLRLAGIALWGACTVALIPVVKETLWSALTDWLLKKMGYSQGADVIASFGGIALPMLVAAGAIYGAFLLGRKEREISAPSALELIFDMNDPRGRYVKESVGEREDRPAFFGRYGVGLKNRGATTLYDVTVRALPGAFVLNTISVVHASRSAGMSPSPSLLHIDALHPGVTEVVELFGFEESLPISKELPFGQRDSFQIQATARDAQTVTANFEYDPAKRPRIRRVPQADPGVADPFAPQPTSVGGYMKRMEGGER